MFIVHKSLETNNLLHETYGEKRQNEIYPLMEKDSEDLKSITCSKTLEQRPKVIRRPRRQIKNNQDDKEE